ncbi:hypothetical protein CPter91_2238 [Collimonas pratensis]|uniref:Uncharacterized protein n=1 Tax=Collimonas pratensis TaxID=279113 RepID=A0A127Q3J1_9BURK|nr:hypothetical protein CPter91_2238 [Collimonas pratensis]
MRLSATAYESNPAIKECGNMPDISLPHVSQAVHPRRG